MFNISVNFKDTKNVDHILENWFLMHFYIIINFSEINDDIQVVSQFPCLTGHPV